MFSVHVYPMLDRTMLEVREHGRDTDYSHFKVAQRLITEDVVWPADIIGRLDWLIMHLQAMTTDLFAELHPQEEPSS